MQHNFQHFLSSFVRIVNVINYFDTEFFQLFAPKPKTNAINSLLMNNQHCVFTITKSQKPNTTILIFEDWLMRIIKIFSRSTGTILKVLLISAFVKDLVNFLRMRLGQIMAAIMR